MNDDRYPVRSAGEPIRFEAAVGGRSRLPTTVAAVAVVFATVLIVRPWLEPAASIAPSSSAGAARGAPDGPPASAAPGVAAVPRDEGLAESSGQAARAEAVRAICMDPGSWRTATIEQWHPDQTVRVWRAIDPRPADGPTDAAIDTVPAVGEAVAAIGYCAPTVGPDRPAWPATLSAWRVDGAVATPIELRQMAPVGVVSAFGALFAPPDAGTPSWPAGVYVFRFAELAAGVEAQWFAVEVRTDRPAARTTRPPPSAVMQPGGGLGAFFLP
jgi:hypothetical protein